MGPLEDISVFIQLYSLFGFIQVIHIAKLKHFVTHFAFHKLV